MSAYALSRVRLRGEPSAAALTPVLLPADPDARAGVAHRLLWTLFADAPERGRDFLWREEVRGGVRPGRTAYLVLSARPPVDRHGLFEVESKPFEPDLAPGDRLGFALRANPVVTRADPVTGRPRRHDVVMDRLHALPLGGRAAARFAAAGEAGRAWLAAQGERAGFRLVEDAAAGTARLRVDGYERARVPRGPGRGPIAFSILDLDGELGVRAPDRFLAALHHGFGKAKAFGCGLMLIRRVRA